MKVKPTQKSIPEGWSLIPAGDVFTFVKSYAFSRDNLVNDTHNKDGIGNIHYGDIHSTFSAPSIDLKKVSVPMIKDVSFVPKSEDLLKDGDLIMADASEDYAGVGVTVSLHGLEDKKVTGGLHTFVLRDTKSKTDKYFRQYIFRNPEVRNSMQKIANGVSVYGISKTAVAKLLLPLPSLSEQNRIVGVLETWDQAIQELSKKIEKKKNIKKGLMQDLLTGKKRIKGFGGKWEIKTIADICDKENSDVSVNTLDFNSGKYPIYGASGFIKNIDFYRQEKSYISIVKDGAGVGRLTLHKAKTSVLATLNILKEKKNGDLNFLYFLLQSVDFKKYIIGSTIPHIYFKDYKKEKVIVPEVKEQAAIAKVITTADLEIVTLEKKLNIFKEQKRYLLNNLITGTIRTPKILKINK